MFIIPLFVGSLFMIWFFVTCITKSKTLSICVNALIMLLLCVMMAGIDGGLRKAQHRTFYLMQTMKKELHKGNGEQLLNALDCYFQKFRDTEDYIESIRTFHKEIEKYSHDNIESQDDLKVTTNSQENIEGSQPKIFHPQKKELDSQTD